MSIKKHVFDDIGYFNEKLRIGGEDAEFCFRALENKIKIFFQSDLLAYHYDRDSFQDFINHQKHWGKHAAEMRKKLNMDYSYLFPENIIAAYFSIIPLAALYTAYIIYRWIFYKPSVILYFPLIFMGKLAQTTEIKNSFKTTGGHNEFQ